MSKVLIAYASMAGSTAEIAQAIAEELEAAAIEAEVVPIGQVSSLEGYAGMVVGGPMIMGWHRDALRFLRQHRGQFEQIPLAVFVTAMKLTKVKEELPAGISFTFDPGIMQEPSSSRLTLRERYSRPSNYLAPVLRASRPSAPASVAIFGGRLLFGRLPWWAVPIALIASAGAAGDKRDWDLIRAWASELPNLMTRSPAPFRAR